MRLTGQQNQQIKLNVGKQKAIYLLGKSSLSFIYKCALNSLVSLSKTSVF